MVKKKHFIKVLMIISPANSSRKTGPDHVDARQLLTMIASSDISYLNFGYPQTRTTFNSYLLRDNSGDYEVFRPFVWNHICFTFKKGSYSRIVLVGESY